MSLTVVRVRGNTVESIHNVSVAVVDPDGAMVASTGDAKRMTLARSVAKPFQAIPLLEDGVVERFGFTDRELALACASHSSEARQVRLVEGLLDRMEFGESDLACGPHQALARDFAIPPITEADRDEVRPVAPSPVASNCSGKHVGMLGLAKTNGWDSSAYHQIGHPVQERVKGVFASYTGVASGELVEVVDGCGVATFGVPLDRLATAMARLATSDTEAAQQIVRAMTTCPEYVAGERRSCTEVMRTFPESVLAKVGADGVYGLALLDRGLGIGIKVEDGSAKAAMVAMIAVLDAMGLEASSRSSLDSFARMPITNTRGEQVGVIEPRGDLTFE